MLEIVCLEQNKNIKVSTRKAIATFTSLGGYMAAAILIGMYLDDKYFNSNGISVIVAAIFGIFMIFLNIFKLVIDSRGD